MIRSAGLAFAAASAALGLTAASADAALPPDVQQTFDRITSDPRYENSTWGWEIADVASGEVIDRQEADRMFVPGSIMKNYTAAAALAELGLDHRFHTPVYRDGRLRHGTLRGDLVLVGSGDFSFGLRDRPDDTLAFTNFDHNEANAVAEARLVKGNPLAALEELAAAVREAGVRRIAGNVVIDNRLFEPFDGWPDGIIDSIWGERERHRRQGIPDDGGRARPGGLAAPNRRLSRRQPGEDAPAGHTDRAHGPRRRRRRAGGARADRE